MNKSLENDEGILLHAHAGKDGGKIADVFTLSAGLVRIYVRCLNDVEAAVWFLLRFFGSLRGRMARIFSCPSMRAGCFWI